MVEPQGVIRTNISVPRDLKARMDKVKAPVNWSAVAAQAFEAKLLELESQKEVKGMEDVIARLKAAAEIEGNADYQAGNEAGTEWAKSEATPKQLRRLETLANDAQYGIDGHLEIYANGMNQGIAEGLFRAIEPNWERDCLDSGSYWECILGDGAVAMIEEHDFAKGFVEGSLAVWEAVKDKL